MLDFSQYVAGPLATMLLSDLGADVVKVERPGGDAYRHYDPVVPGQSRYFSSLNRGKRSVICDLASPEGRELAAGLIARADAVVHNFLPSRAEAFGLDAATVKRLNDRAVVCAISAFGSVGPEAGTPGYDLIAQAVAGLLAAAAHPGQQVPERLGRMPLADFTTGLLAAVAVLSGLLQRQRTPGAPDFEVSLLGASLTLQAQQLATEQETTPADRERPAHPGGSTPRRCASRPRPGPPRPSWSRSTGATRRPTRSSRSGAWTWRSAGGCWPRWTWPTPMWRTRSGRPWTSRSDRPGRR